MTKNQKIRRSFPSSLSRHPGLARLNYSFLLIVGAAISAAPRPSLAQPSSDYSAALSRATELELAGDTVAAAAALLPLEQRFAQDYTLQIRLAWLRYSMGDYAEAETSYRRVLALSPESRDALSGLAWTLVKRGKCDAALAHFEALLLHTPDDELARAGAATCQAPSPVRGAPTVALTGHIYQDNPLKSGAMGLTVAAPLRIMQHWLLGATYRYTNFWTVQGQGYDDGIEQHEAHLSTGVAYDSWGLTGHYSFASEDTGTVGDAHFAGLTARFSPWGDINLEGSLSLYDDLTVGRAALSWRLPLASFLSLTPGFHLQVATAPDGHALLDDTTDALPGGSLTLAFHGERWLAYAGGKYGTEVRPAYLAGTPSVYNTYDQLTWGLWAGASVALPAGWSIFAAYEMNALSTMESSGAFTDNNMHLVSLGVSFSFGSAGGPGRR